jgi:hypothetical protein
VLTAVNASGELKADESLECVKEKGLNFLRGSGTDPSDARKNVLARKKVTANRQIIIQRKRF